MAFLAELKRRRVGKVAIAYGAVAWAVTEAASVVLPALYVPEWAMTMIVVFLLVGFPIAMVLAWVFDVSPTGIERTEPLPGSPPQMQFRTRAAFGVAVVVAMAGLGYLLYRARPRPRRGGGRPQFDCRAALHQPERRREQGLLQRRHVRRTAQPARPRAGAAGCGPHVGVRLQGSQRRHPRSRQGTRRRNRARGQRAPVRRPGAHHGAADRHGVRLPPVVGDLRPQAAGHLRGAGRDRAGHRREAEDRAGAEGSAARAARQGADAERRGLRAVPAGPRHLEAPRRRQPEARDRAVPGSARARPRVRARARRAGVCVRRAAGLHARRGRRGAVPADGRAVGAAGARARSEHRRGARGAGTDQLRDAATCSTPSPASSSRFRWSRTSPRRTTGIRSCCTRSAASTPRSSRRGAPTNSIPPRRCWRRTSPTRT